MKIYCSAVFFWFCLQVAFAQPVLQIDTLAYDFGEILEGERVSHDFWIKNVYVSDLRLQAKSTCGCVAVMLSERRLKPGESAKMTILFNSTLRFGANSKSVFLRAYESVAEQDTFVALHVFSIKAQVLARDTSPILEFDTPIWDFGAVREGDVLTHTFKITNVGESIAHLDAAHSGGGGVIGYLSKNMLNPGEQTQLSYRFDTKGRIGAQLKEPILTVSNAMYRRRAYVIKLNANILEPDDSYWHIQR